MVDVDGPPNHVILKGHLICVGDPLYHKGALPPWRQLASTLRRSGHHEDEITFVIGVAGFRSWRGSHLLVCESESLAHHIYIGDWVLCRRRCTCLTV